MEKSGISLVQKGDSLERIKKSWDFTHAQLTLRWQLQNTSLQKHRLASVDFELGVLITWISLDEATKGQGICHPNFYGHYWPFALGKCDFRIMVCEKCQIKQHPQTQVTGSVKLGIRPSSDLG